MNNIYIIPNNIKLYLEKYLIENNYLTSLMFLDSVTSPNKKLFDVENVYNEYEEQFHFDIEELNLYVIITDIVIVHKKEKVNATSITISEKNKCLSNKLLNKIS